MKQLKRTPCRKKRGTNKKKRGVLQTAWVIPTAETVTPSPNNYSRPPPPDPDTFISPSQVPSDVDSPLGECFTHNVAVIRRKIDGRVRAQISNLSEPEVTMPAASASAAAATAVPTADDLAFIDDSEATAMRLT